MTQENRSQPFLFAVDTKKVPGKVIVHCVRLETYTFDNGPEFDRTHFTLLDPDSDPRIEALKQVLGSTG